MDVDPGMISQMQAVTISREYGSGGGEIAARLATRLGWQLIDHEVVVRVAQRLGTSEAVAESYDERAEGLVERILNSLQMVQPPIPVTPVVPLMTDSHAYHEARRRVIEGAVATGHVVIVGRGAQVLLAQRRDVLHVRIVAPLDLRIAYVMRREGLDQAAARARIQLKERDRIRYLEEVHQQHPENAHLYDLIVNTGILDLDSVVDLIYLALDRKPRRVSAPTEDLGPGAGLPKYPERPGDFHTPESTAQPPV